MNSDNSLEPQTNGPPPGPLQLCEAAGFAFPVFISWPHLIQSRGEEIVRALSQALENRFKDDGGASVFLDVARIRPGYVWDETVRVSLCRSAVTVVFLVRSYFSSDYCCTEWAISEALSARRLAGNRTRSAIIPILLARNLPLPREVQKIQFGDEFQELLVYGRDVTSHEKWNRIVDQLVQQIYELIEFVCTSERDWEGEEKLASSAAPMRFSWPRSVGSGAPLRTLQARAKSSFPRLSVEKPAA